MIMIVAFIFCILFLRLFVLQIVDSKSMQIKAVEQWVRTLPLTAKRGQIVDSQGNILAISYTSYNVYVRAREIKDRNEVASYLSLVLDMNFEDVYKRVINTGISESLLKLQVSEEVASKIVQKNYDGVYVAENIKRYYPYGKSLSQVIGYLTSDSIGQTGLESYYENILSGVDGKYLTQSDVRGITLNDSLNYYVEAIDGLNLKLNIDINIQTIVESVLEKIVLEHNPKSASVIIMDPETSDIIAMGMTPSFDLNNVPRDDVSTLLALSKNITVTDVYEPGSTFKILTLAAALSENLTSFDEHFYCPGYRIVDGEKIKCWKTTGHGDQTLIEAVQNSCNCCFMDLGLRLGVDKLYSYLNAFGIGSSTGVDISGESGGILLDKNSVQTVDLARIAFGQTVAVQELQLLNAFCSVINGGVLSTPSLVDSYYSDSQTLYQNYTLAKNITITNEVSKQMRYILEMALSKTGEMTFIEGYRVGGKTGTAQKYGENGAISAGKYVSSFFGFLNGDKASYALLLCVDEPSSGAYYGSVVAKPYAKEIFEGIIDYKNIPKDNKDIQPQTIVTPSLVGLPLAQALVELEKLNVYYEVDGEGDKIVSQFPLQNTVIDKSTTILIKTN